MADSTVDARAFVERFGWTFPSIEDPHRELAGKLGAAYQPVYALLDEEGNLVGRSLGGEPEDWEKLLAALPGGAGAQTAR